MLLLRSLVPPLFTGDAFIAFIYGMMLSSKLPKLATKRLLSNKLHRPTSAQLRRYQYGPPPNQGYQPPPFPQQPQFPQYPHPPQYPYYGQQQQQQASFTPTQGSPPPPPPPPFPFPPPSNTAKWRNLLLKLGLAVMVAGVVLYLVKPRGVLDYLAENKYEDFSGKIPDVSFDDVRGMDEVREELQTGTVLCLCVSSRQRHV